MNPIRLEIGEFDLLENLTPDVALRDDLRNWDAYIADAKSRKPKHEIDSYGVEVLKMTWLTSDGSWTQQGWHWVASVNGEPVGSSGAVLFRFVAYLAGWRHLRRVLRRLRRD